VRLTTDGNGNILSQQGTFPYGEPWYQLGVGNNFVFTNYDRDSESGMDYALARYYDSRTGTFCSVDPLAGSPGDPQSWNRYPYGRNDPIDITDPSGKSWWSWLIDIGIGIAAALVPELAPGWFGAADAEATVGVTQSLMFSASGEFLGASGGAVYSWGSSTLATIAIEGGLAAAGAAASQAPLSPKDMKRFLKAQNKAENIANKKPCIDFLKAQGIDPSGLQNAIANIQPWNGAQSTISQFDANVFDAQDPFNVQQGARAIDYFKTNSVASLFQDNGNMTVNAVAQENGNNVYFRPSGIFSAGGLVAEDVFHEALHNFTGLGDTRLAQKLGLPPDSQNSQSINPQLAKHGCQ